MLGPALLHGVVFTQRLAIAGELISDEPPVALQASVVAAQMIADRVRGENPRTQRLEDALPRHRIEARGRIADAQQRQRGVARDVARAGGPQHRRPERPRRGDAPSHVLRRTERLHEAVELIEIQRAHQIGIAHGGDDAPAFGQRGRVPPAIGKRFDQQPGAVVGSLVEQHDAADQPVEVLEPTPFCRASAAPRPVASTRKRAVWLAPSSSRTRHAHRPTRPRSPSRRRASPAPPPSPATSRRSARGRAASRPDGPGTGTRC